MKRIVKSSIFALLIIFVLASLAHAKSTSQHITFMVTVLPAHHAYLPDIGKQTSDERPARHAKQGVAGGRATNDLSKWDTEKVTREGKSTLLYTMVE